MALILAIGVTLLLLVGMVGACVVFTNAIEWLGQRFSLSQGAVGSILAAVGTAMPETLVPLVALIGGFWAHLQHPHQAGIVQNANDIGIGTILGAPFLLSTLAMGLAGTAVYYFAAKGKRGRVIHLDLHLLKRDLQFFFPGFGLAIFASFIHVPLLKIVLGIALLLGYGLYVQRTLTLPSETSDDTLEPLLLQPRATTPALGWIVFQTGLSLAGILVIAHFFVETITTLSHLLRISSLVLSLLIVPIATELPEKFNSVVWIAKKKDNLAMGNITGSMVFQSYILSAVGLILTPWDLNTQGLISVLMCFVSSGIIYVSVVRNRILQPQILLLGGLFYALFLGYSFLTLAQGTP